MLDYAGSHIRPALSLRRGNRKRCAFYDRHACGETEILEAIRLSVAHGKRAIMHYPVTPDGRYFVVRGRLWRCTDPGLDAHVREALTRELMSARRAKQAAMRRDDPASRDAARGRVDLAKQALGERGPVWWDDGAPDYNRRMARNTPYAAWFSTLEG